MATIDVYNLDKEKISHIELNEGVFNVPVKNHILHDVVVSQLNNRRSGSASVKNRSEVRGSGIKLWRQKGTGRARAGTASSPTRRGGGVAFGPVPGKYSQKVSKKVKKSALRMALTTKFRDNKLVIIDDFNLPGIKTKYFYQVMKKFEINKALVITQEKIETLEKSSKNLSWVKVMRYQGLNVYDILNHEHLFLVQSAINNIEEALIS